MVNNLVRYQEGTQHQCYTCAGVGAEGENRPVSMVVHHTFRYWSAPSKAYTGVKYKKVCTERFLCRECYNDYYWTPTHWADGASKFTCKPIRSWVDGVKWPVFESGVKAFDGALDTDDDTVEEEEDEEGTVTNFNLSKFAGGAVEIPDEDEIVKD